MAKRIFHLLLLTAILPGGQSFSQQPNRWAFIGIKIDEEVGCINKAYTKYETRWMLKDNNFSKNVDSLEKEFKKANPGHYIALHIYTATMKEPRVIALVEKLWECSRINKPEKRVSSYTFYSATDKESLIKQIETDQKLYPEVKAYKITQWYYSKDILPELELAWEKNNPKGTKEVQEVDHDGVKVQYTISETSAGKIYVVMQATNTHTKLESILTLTGKDGSIIKQTIAPNSTYTKKLPATDTHFEVQVTFKPYQNASGTDVIEYVKKIVKSRVTVKDRKIYTNGGNGKRG